MEHLTQEQIEHYKTGRLGKARDYQEVDAHIATCSYCRDRLFRSTEETATPQTLSRLLEGPSDLSCHPAQDVLVDYVQNKASVPPLAAAHIDTCALCKADAADLRAYLWGLEEVRSAQRSPGRFGMFRARFLYGGALAVAAMAILFLLFKSRPVIVINDAGGRWTLDAWGHLNGQMALPEALEAAHIRALQEGNLETPATLASLRGKSEVLLRPAGMVILSDRPTLEWRPALDATADTEYVCTIVSISDPHFKRPPSKPVKKTFWTLPPKKPPLPRGGIYTWKVIARTKGKSTELTGAVETLPKFKVLEQARVVALAEARKTYGRSHLTMALLYAREGLLEEAEGELAALQQANPNSREIETMRARLSALRGAVS